MAKPHTAKPHPAKPNLAGAAADPARSNALMWMQGLACGGLVAVLPSVALLLGVLLGPALFGLYLDRQAGKPIARSLLLCSLAACVKPVRTLWATGHGVAASIALATDPEVVGTAWAAAAAGWLLAELAPVAVRVVLETLSRTRAAQLRAARAALAEEWGLDPTKPPPG